MCARWVPVSSAVCLAAQRSWKRMLATAQSTNCRSRRRISAFSSHPKWVFDRLMLRLVIRQPRFAKDTSSEVRVYQSKQNRRSTSHHDEVFFTYAVCCCILMWGKKKQTGLSVALYRGRGKVEHKFAYDLVQRTLQLQDTASPT